MQDDMDLMLQAYLQHFSTVGIERHLADRHEEHEKTTSYFVKFSALTVALYQKLYVNGVTKRRFQTRYI